MNGRMRRSRRFQRITTLAVSAMLFTACGGTPNGDTAKDAAADFSHEIELAADYDPNGHFTFAYFSGILGWDPIKTLSGADLVWMSPVYDRLVFRAADDTLEPMLATDWETTDDGTGLILNLRKGVTFSDGTPFNAEAVKINLERAQLPVSTIASEIEQLDSIEVIDEHTVQLNADTGLGALFAALAERPGMMASPTAIAAGNLEAQPVGAGAYTLTSFAAGDTASYAKREGYWDPDAQRIATMDIKLMTDDQTRLNALNSREIDGAVLQPVQVKSAVADDLTVVTAPSARFFYLQVNSAKEPMNDPKVREALNYAIDREAIGDGFFDGLCDPQIQPWPKTSFAYSEEIGDGLDIWPYDPEKAKQLLEEAGVSDGFSLPAVTNNTTVTAQVTEILQEMLGEVGIDVTIAQGSSAQVIDSYSTNKTAAAAANISAASGDPHGVATRYLMPSSVYGSVGNPTPQSTLDLASEAATPVDPEERTPIYADMMQDMIDNPNHLFPLCQLHVLSGFNDNVSGFALNPSGIIDLRGVAVTSE